MSSISPSPPPNKRTSQANPMHAFRARLVDGALSETLRDFEAEVARADGAAGRVFIDKIDVSAAEGLRAAAAQTHAGDAKRRALRHCRDVTRLEASKHAALRRATHTVSNDITSEQHRHNEAALCKRIALHNIDAYFSHVNHQLQGMVRLRRNQVKNRYGELTTTTKPDCVTETVSWDALPQQVEVKIVACRGVRDKVLSGEYIVLVSKLEKLGGTAYRWSKRDVRSATPPPCPLHADTPSRSCEVCCGWAGATISSQHNGTPFDSDVSFNASVFTFFPPREAIKPYAVFLFELIRLPTANNARPTTVGWSCFPVIDGNFTVIQGRFKTPLLRGSVDAEIEHFSTIQSRLGEDLEMWLGNLYFEVIPYQRECEGQGEFALRSAHTEKRLGLGGGAKSASSGEQQEQQQQQRRRSSALALQSNVQARALLHPKRKSVVVVDPMIDGSPSASPAALPSKNGLQRFQSWKKRLGSVTLMAPEVNEADENVSRGSERSVFRVNPVGEGGCGDSNAGSECGSDDVSDGSVDCEEEGAALFDLMDTDKSGTLAADEVTSYLAQYPEIAPRLGISSTADFISLLDTNQDGSIDRMEFACVWSAIASGAANLCKNDVKEKEKTVCAAFSGIIQKEETDLFSKLKGISQKNKKNKRIATERGERWGQYSSVAHSSLFGQPPPPSWCLQLEYCWRGVTDELQLHRPKTARFWYNMVMLCVATYVHTFLHGLAKYVAVAALSLPTSTVAPQWYGLHIDYDMNHTTAFSELVVLLCAMSVGAALPFLLAFGGYLIKAATNTLPEQISRFVYCFSASYLVFPFIHCIADTAFMPINVDSNGVRQSDILRLTNFFAGNNYEPFFGGATFAVVYLNLAVLLCVGNFYYTMRVHLNGILQDCFWRINICTAASCFVPNDLEVSLKELDYICTKAEAWRGAGGQRRKTCVTLVVQTDEADPDYMSSQMHIEIFTLNPYGGGAGGGGGGGEGGRGKSQQIYREFYVLPDGGILEARKQRLPSSVKSNAAGRMSAVDVQRVRRLSRKQSSVV